MMKKGRKQSSGKKKNKGLSYTLEDETLLAYMALSTEDKLKWVEEINELTRLALTPAEKEIREKIRRCEI